MAVKIPVDDDVYDKLVALKGKNESFSDFFLRLLARRKTQVESLLELAGIAKDSPELDEIFKNIRKRKSDTSRSPLTK
ncbi:antitoxin VapB family protein [Candidatus Micrarchaeota archaeon]|nr:antitoxin VapB family protein [Candidatus Micrarchaeota archaeon]